MTIAMAEDPNEGAPIAKDAIDPDLVRLARTRPKIGVLTAAGLVFLCAFFLIRLAPDRSFGGAGQPETVKIADLAAGRVAPDSFVKIAQAELVMSHAIRTSTAKNGIGMRVTPVRGTGERVWIAMSGDGWDDPSLGLYTGRVKKLHDLPFAKTMSAYAIEHPRPVFAAPATLRAAFGSGTLTSVTGDAVTLKDADRVAFDTVDPAATLIVATLNDRFATKDAWQAALTKAGITITQALEVSNYTARFQVAGDPATLTPKLVEAQLLAPIRFEPVAHHYETTWGALKTSSPAGLSVEKTVIPDAQVDMVGLYVAREIPADAYALILDEHPEDYWYVLPITIGLAVLGLVFAWALVRAVKRDLLPTRA
ncbi:MAG TPA: hypothetical protein VGC41_26045 [Kofleriaceae bacterium]